MNHLSSNLPTILIVGASFHTLRQYLLNHGMDYVILRDVAITKHPEKKLKRRVVCDFSSDESIFAVIDDLVKHYHVDGVVAIYENYILPAAKIAEYLNLPGMPVVSAEACTDKFLMRQLFTTATKKVSPDYATVASEDDVRAFATAHKFPIILKPTNLAKSLLVTKNHTLEELLANYRTIVQNIDHVYKRYAPNKQPEILIEEFMEGSIHSVDAFVDSEGVPNVLDQVVDYQTGYDIGYNDNFHYSRILPSKLSPADIAAVRETAVIGCQALGMRSSPAHVEIILTREGPRIVEIGARNGGYRERMHGLANGVDITGGALDIAFGRKPDITSKRNDSCAILELFPKNPGIFKELAQEKELSMLSSLVYYDVKAPIGSFIGKSSDGYKMTAVIMLHNKDSQAFDNDLAWINKAVRVVTESLPRATLNNPHTP